MKNTYRLIWVACVAVLFLGCTKHQDVIAVKSMEGGIVDTPAKKQRIAKLINSKDDVKNVFDSIVNYQKGDIYESTIEYKNRMDNAKINKYAVMDMKTRRKYDPDKQIYTIFFDMGLSNIPISAFIYQKGKIVSWSDRSYLALDSNETYYLTKTHKSSKYTDRQSNAFGVTVDVTHYVSTDYEAYLDNFEEVINMKNVVSYSTGDDSIILHPKSYAIAIPADKNKARQLDAQKLKLKAGVRFTDTVAGLYHYYGGSGATIDLPIAFHREEYLFKAHLEEFVLYVQDNGEILFQFAD